MRQRQRSISISLLSLSLSLLGHFIIIILYIANWQTHILFLVLLNCTVATTITTTGKQNPHPAVCTLASTFPCTNTITRKQLIPVYVCLCAYGVWVYDDDDDGNPLQLLTQMSTSRHPLPHRLLFSSSLFHSLTATLSILVVIASVVSHHHHQQQCWSADQKSTRTTQQQQHTHITVLCEFVASSLPLWCYC